MGKVNVLWRLLLSKHRIKILFYSYLGSIVFILFYFFCYYFCLTIS